MNFSMILFRKMKQTRKFSNFTFKMTRFLTLTVWLPILYAIYLYKYEKNELDEVAREFTAFKN